MGGTRQSPRRNGRFGKEGAGGLRQPGGGGGGGRGCAGRCPGGREPAAEGEPVLLLGQLLRPGALGAGGAGGSGGPWRRGAGGSGGAGGAGAAGGGPPPGRGGGQWKPVWLGPRGLGSEAAEPDRAGRRDRGALVSVPGAPDVRRCQESRAAGKLRPREAESSPTPGSALPDGRGTPQPPLALTCAPPSSVAPHPGGGRVAHSPASCCPRARTATARGLSED